MLTLLQCLLIIIVAMVGLTFAFLKLAPTFGARPDSDTLARIKASPNFNGKTFVNLTATQASTINAHSITAKPQPKKPSTKQPKGQDGAQNNHILTQFLFPPKGKNPETPIHTLPLNLIAPKQDKSQSDAKLETTLNEGELVWLGHSTVLFKTAGLTLITDPVFHRASPVPLGGKPFVMTHTPTAQDLPFIDAVLISHDHYDHLDHKAIKQMRGKVGHFYVPLGVKAHLERWGVDAQNISEYDWYESTLIKSTLIKRTSIKSITEEVEVTFTPARHFSGRSITGHRTTLWGGWAVTSANLKVFFSGDGGYSDEFAKIGKRFGGFDIAFIEDGAYNERWQDVHMLPEQSAQAGIDVGAKVIMPIHWGKFDLSTHHWREPVERIRSAISEYNENLPDNDKVAIATPRIGQVFNLKDLPSKAWWQDEP